MSVRIQLRRDTAANWTATNPTLTQGEPGYETDTGKIKYGDGTTAWNSLAYAPAAAVVDGTIVDADINAAAAISLSKLATGALPTAITVASSNIVDGTIVDADVSASAAIAGTKISPNFGSQNRTSTGTSTAASFIPTSSTAPTNGLYLSAANSVALSTNGTQKLLIDSLGNVTVKGSLGDITLGSGAAITFSRNDANFVSATAGSAAYLNYEAPNLHVFRTGSPTLTERLRITSTGQLSHIGAGSSGSPAVSFSGSAPSNSLVVDSNGLIGAGTSSPAAEIHINSSSLSRLRFTGGAANATNFDLRQGVVGVSNSGVSLYDVSAAATRVVVDNQGRVGIGNTTGLGGTLGVSGNISLSGAGTGPRYLGLLDETNTYAGSYILQAGGGSAGFGGAITMYGHSHATYPGSVYIGTSASSGGKVYIGTNNALDPASTRMTVTTTGVGIGTASPQGILDLTGTSRIVADVSGATPKFTGLNAAASAQVELALDGSALAFRTLGAEKARIDSSGRLGIGTASPSVTLQVGDGTGLRQAYISGNGYDLYLGASGGSAFGFASQAASLVFNTTAVPLTIGTIQSQPLVFGSANFERARITSSGQLLVGTTTNTNNTRLNERLAVVSTGENNIGGIAITSYSGAAGADAPSILDLQRSRGTTDGILTAVTAGDGLGTILFRGSNGSAFANAASIQGQVDTGTVSGTSMPGRLVFSVTRDGQASPTEAMRITNGGSVCIGSANTQTSRLSLEGSSFDLYNAVFHDTRTGSISSAQVQFKRNTAVVGNISTTDVATAFNTSSDYRLKENVVSVTDGITRLQQLKPSRFNFIANPDKTVDGFIAHEVQTIVPEAITGEKDAVDDEGNPVYQGIDQSKLVPLLTAALQEAIGEIESLKARLDAANL